MRLVAIIVVAAAALPAAATEPAERIKLDVLCGSGAMQRQFHAVTARTVLAQNGGYPQSRSEVEKVARAEMTKLKEPGAQEWFRTHMAVVGRPQVFKDLGTDERARNAIVSYATRVCMGG